MPEMSQEQVSQLRSLAEQFAVPRGGEVKVCLGSGGSAAVFKYAEAGSTLALKVYDPSFFDEKDGPAERHRIELQRALIGHNCRTLVKVNSIDFALNTCFIAMQYVEGIELSKCLNKVPRHRILDLIHQLALALKFLYEKNLVHRDIKPHNIMVSDDFAELTLIDLGVVRELDSKDDYAGTDHGVRKPFIATAQYSSPEYLFRLVAPSPDLWLGLTYYQIGGVLHDLIVCKPMFFEEIASENRYVVAMAVLSTRPSFETVTDVDIALKSLATRCLSKELKTRLSTVSWNDFSPSVSPAERLRSRLNLLRDSDAVKIELEKSQLAITRRNFFASIVREFKLQFREEFEEVLCEEITTSVPDGSVFLTIALQRIPMAVDLSMRIAWGEEGEDGTLLVSGYCREDDGRCCYREPEKPISSVSESALNALIMVHDLKNFMADALVKAMDVHAAGEGVSGCAV
jgi:serine/threonine-protein kinase